MNTTQRIKEKALAMGFDLVGIAPARPSPRKVEFEEWLHRGYQGDMAWMAREPERRTDPDRVVPGARSVLCVGMSYYLEDPPSEVWNDPLRGRIARYAWGLDYHRVLEPMLKELLEFIRGEMGGDVGARYYVDTGPVLEREAAWQAGLGFIGKNTLLIHPEYGSYIFLGEILIAGELDYDQPADEEGASFSRGKEDDSGSHSSCGQCRRCLDVCPTGALVAPYRLDSRLCISYLTIEHKGSIPESLRPLMKNWIYGCDECQTICPWVKRFSRPGKKRFLQADSDVVAPRLDELLALDEDGFRKRFRHTPLQRTKRGKVLRNVAVALGNSGDKSVEPLLEKAMHDAEPLVREHAAWAISQLRSA